MDSPNRGPHRWRRSTSRHCACRCAAQHRLAHSVWFFYRKLGSPSHRSSSHLVASQKLFGRIAELNSNNASIRWIGRPFDEPGALTPPFIQKAINKAIADTATNTGLVLTVAFDYGSRAELLRASQRVIVSGGEITPDLVSANMYDPSIPPVDVVVRTSGESRISNFLLWQIAGAKVYFTERTWPDFNAAELDAAIALVEPKVSQ